MLIFTSLLALLGGCGDRGDDTDASTATPDPAVACASEAALRATSESVRLERDGCGGIVLDSLRIVGEGDLRLELFTDGEQLIPQIVAGSDATFRALHLSGTWWAAGEAEPVLWRQGYHSWSPSGVFPLEEIVLGPDELPEVGGDGTMLSVAEETPFTSWWAGLAGRSGGASVLAGVLAARQSKSWVAFDHDAAHVVWGGRGAEVAMSAGDRMYLDPLWLGVGSDPGGLWRAWAEAVAEVAPPRLLDDAPPTGWATWYEHYADVSEDDVRANLAVAAELAARSDLAPLEVLQIDDGWARAWGDWSPNERFPSGMGALAAEIDAAGLTPGIWMAPFLVSREAPIFAEHPDWWVRDAAGEVVEDGAYAILDATHPDAGAWMADQVARRVAEGYRYLKLDFLYAGAVEGERYLDVNGAVAYQVGMTLLRQAAGEAWLLACGAPMLPSVGFAESWRSGPDIAFEVAPDPQPAFLRNQVRSTAARAFVNGLWWFNDADQILLREPFGPREARGAVVANAVSGGVWMLGDDLVALPEERVAWALDPAIVGTAGGVAVPDDPLVAVSGFDPSPLVEATQDDDRVPVRWELPDGTVALLNLGTDAVEVDGPGGTELLGGESADAGPRTLAPGEGELWRP